MSKKFALIIANAEYTDPGLAKLSAPGHDAEDFARVLRSPNICAFDDVNIILNQTEHIVRDAIYSFFNQATKDDLLVLFFSGHGIRDDLGTLYLAVKDTNRLRLPITAISKDFVLSVSDRSRTKRQVIVLDCCNSGAFAEGTKAEIGGTMGMTKALEGFGRFILTASDAVQFAWEGDKVIGETNKSLFTHFLVKGLEGEADIDSDGRITVDELYDYAFNQISRVTPKQTPTKSSSKVEGEIVLRQNIRIEDTKPIPLSTELIDEIEDTRPYVREAAVLKLERILKGRNIGQARSAREALEKIVEDENTTRRVAQAATQVLNSLHVEEQEVGEERRAREETERLEKLKSEENRLAYEKTQREAQEESDRLAAQKREENRLRESRENAERLVAQKTEEDRIAREKAETERKAKEEVNRLAIQEVQAKRKAKEESKRLANKKWVALLNYLQLNLKNKPNIYILFGVAALLVAAMAILINRQFFQTNLFYSGISGAKTDIYSYDGRTETIIVTHDILGIKNWSPVSHPNGQLYFTSNKDGSAEIYRIKSDGTPEQVTDGQGNDSSWAPAFDLMGQLYFTSNSDGTAEIYRRKSNGQNEKVTDGKGNKASWAPAFDLMGQLYFTSNSDGTAEIYCRKNDGKNEQVTDTDKGYASWGPVFDSVGRLYFTSDRTGKAEIYIMESDGAKPITNKLFSNWAPVIEGKNIYFTSNRNGHDEVFLLDDTKAIPISSIDKSWTVPLSARYPFSTP